MFYEVADEGFRYSRIDTVHRHVVAVVCCPSEGEFREVAGTYNESSELVAEVHKDLRALTSLRILVGDVVNGGVVTYVLEVLEYGLRNVYLANGDAESLHEFQGVLVGAVGGSEARHCDAHDALSRQSQFVEGLHADQQRQRGVEAAADAYDDSLGIGVDKTFCESAHLDVENLVVVVGSILALRHERCGIEGAQQFEVARLYGVAVDDVKVYLCRLALCVDIGAVGATFHTQAVDVNLTYHHLGLQREALRRFEEGAVLVDQCVAAIDDVLGAFAKARAAIDVARDGACALL